MNTENNATETTNTPALEPLPTTRTEAYTLEETASVIKGRGINFKALNELLPGLSVEHLVRIVDAYNKASTGTNVGDLRDALNVTYGLTPETKKESRDERFARFAEKGWTYEEALIFSLEFAKQSTGDVAKDAQNAFAVIFGLDVPLHPTKNKNSMNIGEAIFDAIAGSLNNPGCPCDKCVAKRAQEAEKAAPQDAKDKDQAADDAPDYRGSAADYRGEEKTCECGRPVVSEASSYCVKCIVDVNASIKAGGATGIAP